jgi:dye decolorizing peroxidase
VLDLDDPVRLPDVLDELGVRIAALAVGDDPATAGLPPSRLTVTVGVGAAIFAALRPDASVALTLPPFARDAFGPDRSGGDLVLFCRADDAAVAALARQALTAQVGGGERWSASGFTSAPDGPATRNIIGFHDGLSIPHTAAERETTVWLPGGDLAGATVAVVRVMPIDTAAFTSLDVSEQERAVGRERSSGVPLSGGSAIDDPDLTAKDATGVYAIPVDAHVRRAHPLPAGLDGLMLRRSYSYSAGAHDQGLVFTSFQNDVDLFIRTQLRLDESDALLAHTTTTASGVFLVLPGFAADRPLGRALRS